MSLQDKQYSPTELLDAVAVPHPFNNDAPNRSIGMSLNHLNRLGEYGFKVGEHCDGIDALCYHLDGYTVRQALEVLQRVLDRFKVIDGK